MFWMANAHGEIVTLSPDWCALTGQTHAEAKGFGWLDAVYEDDRTLVAASYARAVVAHARCSVCYRVQRRAGGFAWVAAGADPSFGLPNREFLGYLGAFAEVPGPADDNAVASGGLPTVAPSSTPVRMTKLITEAHHLASEIRARGIREALELALALTDRRVH